MFPGASYIQAEAMIEHLRVIRQWVTVVGVVTLVGVLLGVLVAFGIIGAEATNASGY